MYRGTGNLTDAGIEFFLNRFETFCNGFCTDRVGVCPSGLVRLRREHDGLESGCTTRSGLSPAAVARTSAADLKPAIGEPGAGSREPGAGSREPGAGSRVY